MKIFLFILLLISFIGGRVFANHHLCTNTYHPGPWKDTALVILFDGCYSQPVLPMLTCVGFSNTTGYSPTHCGFQNHVCHYIIPWNLTADGAFNSFQCNVTCGRLTIEMCFPVSRENWNECHKSPCEDQVYSGDSSPFATTHVMSVFVIGLCLVI